MINFIGKLKTCDKVAACAFMSMVVISLVDIIRYAALMQSVAFITVLVVNVLFILAASAAVFGRVHALFAVVTVFSAVLFFITDNFETTLYNITYLFQAAASAVGAVGGTVFAVIGKNKPKVKPVAALCISAAVVVAVFGTVWGACTANAKGRTEFGAETWAVPSALDSEECENKGTLEKLDYTTKAYATDNRAVEKSAYVYLPYGYDGGKQYNILYLMHGTGDNEEYWLKKFSYNKIMVDNMIDKGIIDPLIIVTPTFYVENDCKNNLDPLTYTFKDELRNDLMPAAESKYSTYAATADDAGFKASRVHRAFAGLSRGAVTTLHSVFCGSLDYFASFGTFSSSRTDVEDYKKANFAPDTKDLSVECWYVASGAFDFGFKSQWSDWNTIVKADDRLIAGQNTFFDNYPMRYHSMGNWHLALYNFLLRIF